jgi:hypothetical protein
MKRISRMVIAGCTLSAMVVAVCAASANGEPARSSYGAASDNDVGISNAFAGKDGGITNAFAGKDGGALALAAKEGGAAAWESLTADFAKDGGRSVNAKEGGTMLLETPWASAKDGGRSLALAR